MEPKTVTKRVSAVTLTLYPDQIEILDRHADMTGGNRSSAARSIIMEWERIAGECDMVPVWLERKVTLGQEQS